MVHGLVGRDVRAEQYWRPHVHRQIGLVPVRMHHAKLGEEPRQGCISAGCDVKMLLLSKAEHSRSQLEACSAAYVAAADNGRRPAAAAARA